MRILVADSLTILSLLVLFSNKAATWFTDIGFIGIAIILLVCLIISVLYNAYLLLKTRGKYNDLHTKIVALSEGKIKQIEGRELLQLFNQLSQKTVNEIFKMFSTSIAYPNEVLKVNIHYFEHQTIEGNDYLVKIRKYCYETEPHPVDFTLERINLNSNGMVVCKSYNSNTVILENITHNHVAQYEDDIKNHVDPNIKWVLTSPVWKDNNTNDAQKKGVICIFGNCIISDDIETREKLKMLCLELSTCISGFV